MTPKSKVIALLIAGLALLGGLAVFMNRKGSAKAARMGAKYGEGMASVQAAKTQQAQARAGASSARASKRETRQELKESKLAHRMTRRERRYANRT